MMGGVDATGKPATSTFTFGSDPVSRRAAIVTTLRNTESVLASFLDYHLSIGFDHVFLFFDDPGCLWLWRAGNAAPGAVVHYRHRDRDRWLAPGEAGFLPDERTPMNWGFAAVDSGAAGALSEAEARRRVLLAAGVGGEAP